MSRQIVCSAFNIIRIARGEPVMTRYVAALSLWFLASIFTATVFAEAASAEAAPANSKVLRVAVSTDNPPLAYAANDKAVGIEVDLSRMLQLELGAQLQLQLLPTSDVISALERGEVDMVMAGLVVTPELEKRVELGRSYLHSGEMAIIRTDDIMRFRGPAALLQDALKVGVVVGSAGADYVKATMNHPVTTGCAKADECLQALLDKRIDVFVGSPATSWRLATELKYGALMSLYRPLTDEYFAWAVAKGNVQLRDRLDAALERMQQAQMFEHILNRWVPVRVSVD
jgi:polar amino acid transport system substrate-binding protein